MNMNGKPQSSDVLKFAMMSIIGAFLFLVPIPDGAGAFNIPLGFVINWVGGAINSISVGEFGLIFLLACLIITVSFLGSLLAYVAKPNFIMDSDKLRGLFLCHPIYFISKLVGVIVAWLVFFGEGQEWAAGLDWLIGWDGGRLMLDLIAGSSGLIAIFLVLGLLIPLLTDFGLMEFLGILISKVVRLLFTVPGRSSVDLLSSWFSSSAAGIIITRDQHEKGFYTNREASVICVNFAVVSLPFTFFVASTLELTAHFQLFYLVIVITGLLLALIMPRIWPLRGIKDDYLPGVGKQIDEEVPAHTSLGSHAILLASQRAAKTNIGGVIKSGLSNWLNIFMDLIPVIMAWGTIALVVHYQTPLFDWLSWPFRWYLELLRVPGAEIYAPLTIVGFIDMFIPAFIMGGDAPIDTRFIIGALSIVQIIYLAETGILILKSKLSLNIGHLAIIFLMRTILALPVIVLLTRLLFNP